MQKALPNPELYIQALEIITAANQPRPSRQHAEKRGGMAQSHKLKIART